MTDSLGIPGYRITRKLGQGGMASVYLAIQESFDREVALKVMSPFLNSDPSFATRFAREARIVAQIHHSSIVPVIDVGQHQGHHYLCMEFLPGGDLKQRIVAGRHGPNLALNVCVAISSALDLAHRKGFVHRDIKPENILFREDGTPVLTDFGIARAIDAGTQLTMAGTMVGTPSYMSPEQVKGAELDGRSDLYSLGVVFHEMLVGLVPFRADSTMSLAIKHLSEPLPILPPQFAMYQPFLDRLMAKDREDRFATGAEVIRALRLITDMAMAREATLLRSRTPPPATDSDMQTLIAPSTAWQGTLPGASFPDTVRIPSTSTQPSGVMQIPAATGQPAAVEPLPHVPTVLEPRPAEAPLLTVARPAAQLQSEQDGIVSPPSSNPPPSRASATAKPLQVGVPALLQKITRSRHSMLAAAGCIGLIAIGTGYLLGRTTEPDSSVQPAALAASRTGLETAAAGQTLPVAATLASTGDDAASTGLAGDAVVPAVNQEGEIATAPGEVDADHSAVLEAARLKDEEERKLRAEQKRAREEAQRQLAAAQRETNLQAQRAREARIKELLVLAKVDIAQGNLVSPADNNAVARYQEVLAKEPTQVQLQEARNGLKRVSDVLVQEADRAIANGAKEIAGQLIDSLRLVQGDHPELGRLQARLQDNEPVKSLSRTQQASVMRALGRVDEALKRSPQSLDSIKDALKEYDRVQQISNVASGLSIRRARIEEAFAAATQTEIIGNKPKRAREIFAIARGRGWLTPELLRVEQGMDATQSP